MKRLIAGFALALTLALAPVAAADTPLPPTLRSAGVSQAQWDIVQAELTRVSRALNVSERTLRAAAERLGVRLAGAGRDSQAIVAAILEAAEDQARRVEEAEQRYALLAGSSDPQVNALIEGARTATREGRLDDADALLARAEAHDLAAIENRSLRVAATMALRGDTALLDADHVAAAGHYARAAEAAPAGARERWLYTLRHGIALYDRGRIFADPEMVRAAVEVYRQRALPLVSRESRPADWVATQNNLAIALGLLGQRGDVAALSESIVAHRNVLQIVTSTSSPDAWATAQNNLGASLLVLGERGDDEALAGAITAFRAALQVRTRQAWPSEWAQLQNNLGNALGELADRGDRAALAESISAYQAALTVRTRESTPFEWANTQNNLAGALYRLGEGGDSLALERSIVAFRAALEVYDRETAPAQWGMVLNNLGVALRVLGEREGGDTLPEALRVLTDALQVRTRTAAPALWARTQFNISLVHRAYVLGGDRTHVAPGLQTARAALSAYEQVRDSRGAEQARFVIADLESR